MNSNDILYITDVKNTPVFSMLETGLKTYDWYSDPNVISTKDSDPAFADSMSIQLIPNALMYMIRPSIFPNYLESTLTLSRHCSSMIYFIQRLYPDHYWLKSHIVGLLPNGKQDMHIDSLFWHKHTIRLVLPIIVNDHCYTNVNSIDYKLDSGLLYEMNNLKPHRSVNLGNDIRVSIFFDLISPNNLPIIEEHYIENGIRKIGSIG
jgi:hypothetical protein